MFNSKKKILLLSFLILTNITNTSYSIDKKISDKIDKIDYKASDFLNDREEKLRKDTHLDTFAENLISNANEIENFNLRKDTIKQQISMLEDDYYNKYNKFSLYTKAFVSNIGYGVDLSFYYRNFIGLGFIFNNQLSKYSNVFGELLIPKFYISNPVLSDSCDEAKVKLNFESQTFVVYASLRPFRNGFYVNAGVSFTKLTSEIRYAKINRNRVETSNALTRYVIDDYSPRAFIATGFDFQKKNFIIGIEGGLLSINTERLSQDMEDTVFAKMEEKGLSLKYTDYSGKDKRTINTLTDYHIYTPEVNNNVYFVKLSVGYKFSF